MYGDLQNRLKANGVYHLLSRDASDTTVCAGTTQHTDYRKFSDNTSHMVSKHSNAQISYTT